MTRDAGFSFVELLVALLLVTASAAVMAALAGSGRTAFAIQPDAADMQQRVRVAADALYKDLVIAGAGPYTGRAAGPLVNVFAPVLPYRIDPGHPDPPGTFRTDTISLMSVPVTAAQTTLTSAGPGASTGSVSVDTHAGCPVSAPACGVQAGMTTLIFEKSGLHDTFSVSSVIDSTVGLQSTSAAPMYAMYPPQAEITEVVMAVYSLKSDPLTGAYQLVRSNAAAGSDVPVVDHIVRVTFEYYGDPQPPRLTGTPLDDPVGPWTTYGAPPPAPGDQGVTGGYPPGESCLFLFDAESGAQSPRLASLRPDGSSALVKLTAAELTDGPWCPDAGNPNRWDADLLRIRTIVVTLRLQSANAALRGPAGVLFANGGTAQGVGRWLPDLETTFRVTPRNLNLRR